MRYLYTLIISIGCIFSIPAWGASKAPPRTKGPPALLNLAKNMPQYRNELLNLILKRNAEKVDTFFTKFHKKIDMLYEILGEEKTLQVRRAYLYSLTNFRIRVSANPKTPITIVNVISPESFLQGLERFPADSQDPTLLHYLVSKGNEIDNEDGEMIASLLTLASGPNPEYLWKGQNIVWEVLRADSNKPFHSEVIKGVFEERFKYRSTNPNGYVSLFAIHKEEEKYKGIQIRMNRIEFVGTKRYYDKYMDLDRMTGESSTLDGLSIDLKLQRASELFTNYLDYK